MRCRQFDAGIEKLCRELLHGAVFAVNKERALRASLLLPRQQLCLVGVGGEAVDGVDACSDGDILTEDCHMFGTVDDAACERPNGGVADKHDARILTTKIVLEVVADATAGAHSRAGYDDAPPWTSFIATDSAVSRVKCNPGR